MTPTTRSHLARITNITLRLASLGSKLLLTLYITRYLNLSAMGLYGLINGSVMVLMVVVSMRLDYVVSRELVGATPLDSLIKIRDQAVFSGLNLLILGSCMALYAWSGVSSVSHLVLVVIFILSALEIFGDTTFLNFISMGRPLVANLLFFIRSAFWVFPVIGFGLLSPEFRTTKFVFSSWILGGVASLLLSLYLWRNLPWRDVIKIPVDWTWIKKSVRGSFFIWLGTLGGTAGFYVDRFVLADHMSLDLVGVASFYSSFGGALFALIHSGVLSFAYPRLISLHREQDKSAYHHEVTKLGWNVALTAGILGILISIAVPLLGHYFSRPEIANQSATLWMILFAAWLRCNSETFYYILFSQHLDGPLWIGGLLYLIPSLFCNMIFVPLFGFHGIGYSSIISSLFVLGWRGWYVYKNHKINH